MAITRKTIRDKFKKAKEAPFTKEELEYISEAENYIDKELEKQFDNPYGTNIDLTIARFSYSPTRNKAIEDVKSYRKDAMARELEYRYKAAGWRISYHFDDDLDGPNMSGGDYMILS